MTPPGQRARQDIDRLLGAAGWAVRDVPGADLSAARGVVLREAPLLAGFDSADHLGMEYDHPKAVADGVNLNDDVCRIKTEVSGFGATVEAGCWLQMLGQPWFLAVNLVNPHVVMFLNADRPGEPSQVRAMRGNIRAEPADPRHARRWRSALRERALYCYNMLAYIDGDFMAKAVGQMLPGGVDGGWVATEAVRDV